MTTTLEKLALLQISPVTDEDILGYLRCSCKIAEVSALAERDALILNVCESVGLTVSDEELQAAGDAFRLENKLSGASETLEWLSQQRITVEDWSRGIRVALLNKKLKELFFGGAVDNHYMGNRDAYRRVALSQILVTDLSEALKVNQAIREENASFCALALEYSKAKQSKQNGGFVGIRFVAELISEIAQAISEAKEGEVIRPVQSQLGFHLLKIEKWFPAELNELARQEILESLFQNWLRGAKQL